MAPQLGGFGRSGYCQPAGASRQRCPRALHRPMAIAVRLYHRTQSDSIRELVRKPPAVALDRRVVDHGDGALQGDLDHVLSAAGRAPITSVAMTDSIEPSRSAAIRPARWCA